jgi:UDP-2-acetamido-3-amino-2,3-dideoxy-glucuronate N-acetyltransferase
MVAEPTGAADSSTFVHPLALCDTGQIGPRSRIWPFAVVQAGAVIGADVNVCSGSFVEDGAVIGNGVTVKNNVSVWRGVHVSDNVFLGPGCTFTNELRPRAARRLPPTQLATTVVEQGVTIGANATVLCGITIGAYSMLGAGAVVVRSTRPFSMVLGVPARLTGWVCRCGVDLPVLRGSCDACGELFSWSEGTPTSGFKPGTGNSPGHGHH